MRRILFLLCVCWSLVPVVYSQDNSNKHLHFVYIAHETSTPINQLCQRVQTIRNDADETGDAFILYLADGSSSLVSLHNLEDKTGKKRDSEDAFLNIIDALQNANSHEVSPRYDCRNLINLFEEFNFATVENQLLFKTVTLDFYVGPTFWTLGNNEKVLAHLYFSLNASAFSLDTFSFNVFKPKGQSIEYTPGKLFGNLNVDSINKRLKILEY